jgi:hypothetical protein
LSIGGKRIKQEENDSGVKEIFHFYSGKNVKNWDKINIKINIAKKVPSGKQYL